MIEVTEPPERLVRLGRRQPDQARLFDTQELTALEEDPAPGEAPAEEKV
jgi:hypothetical protein